MAPMPQTYLNAVSALYPSLHASGLLWALNDDLVVKSNIRVTAEIFRVIYSKSILLEEFEAQFPVRHQSVTLGNLLK